VVDVLLVCKWGGEITHAGLKQTSSFAPIFWDHVMSYGREGSDLDIDVYDYAGTVNFKNSASWITLMDQLKVGEMKHRDAKEIFTRRLAFLHGMTVSASDEGRVYATAQAFYSATYVDCYRQLGPEGRAMLEQHGGTLEKLARNVVNIGEYAQATLADMESTTSDLMEQSKQQVQRIVSSDRSTSPLSVCLALFASLLASLCSLCLSLSACPSLFLCPLLSHRLSLRSLLTSPCSVTFF
jgi:hypothetical protein